MLDEPVPSSDELRTVANWYASEEFTRLLLAAFEQARLAAIASHAADEVDVPFVVDESVEDSHSE